MTPVLCALGRGLALWDELEKALDCLFLTGVQQSAYPGFAAV